ncbi:Beta/gamma crystallin [Lasiodiplodia theobromae]|uniref:Beta gamma crystallin protein n=1 Tax=Lasiodiplodia hormozganensis TaxID=869390 RepID=A0AA39WZH9_9PEZI|nr:Beta/gamma crystallin [Lasiodiplodia theobromae]KAF4533945.1 Beta/gamma crystallin [Lasiodiplodia theobromae]KAF9638233.1 Beta/gamma crystallin [Lasiodiplodia theobromae]KAK0624475.1 hypothetical protein DIS24_g11187 [Lasiodiplodia hormozganensis]
MQLTTLISATLVACSGFAAAAPNAIPTTDLVMPTAVSELPTTDYQGISSEVGQEETHEVEKRGGGSNWVRHVKFCEHNNGGGVCNVKDFKPSTGCYNLWGWLNDKVSSIYLAPGTMCILYADTNCKGHWLKAFDPGYKNLKLSGEMNDRISSMTCYAR